MKSKHIYIKVCFFDFYKIRNYLAQLMQAISLCAYAHFLALAYINTISRILSQWGGAPKPKEQNKNLSIINLINHL